METWLIVLLVVVLLGGGAGVTLVCDSRGPLGPGPATKPTADNQWVVSGPHIMILPTDVSQLDASPTDWTKGVRGKGTPYAHIMVPTTSMAKEIDPLRQD